MAQDSDEFLLQGVVNGIKGCNIKNAIKPGLGSRILILLNRVSAWTYLL